MARSQEISERQDSFSGLRRQCPYRLTSVYSPLNPILQTCNSGSRPRHHSCAPYLAQKIIWVLDNSPSVNKGRPQPQMTLARYK